MKVLFISNSAVFGGAEAYVVRVARELTRRNMLLHVVASPASNLVRELIRAGVSVESADLGIAMGRARGWVGTLALLDAYAGQRLRKLLLDKRNHGFACLICQDQREQILASRYASQLGYRVVWIIHSPLHYPLHRMFGYKLLRQASAYADCIIVVCEYLRDKLIAEGIPAEKLKVIPPFVDLDQIDGQVSGEGCGPRFLRRVGYLGRLARGKDVDTLLQAMAKVVRIYPDIELAIAGSGPTESGLTQLASKLNIQDRVRFLGFVDNPVGVMTQMDVFVNPSCDPGEALPANILEAFALRRPVVATDHGGIPEIVRQGETGLLVPMRDHIALAQALLRLVQNPAWARRLGEQARSSLTPKYVMPFVVDQLMSEFLGFTE